MSDYACPRCASDRKIIHYWRAKMDSLQWIDDFKCLDCGLRWETSTPLKPMVARAAQ